MRPTDNHRMSDPSEWDEPAEWPEPKRDWGGLARDILRIAGERTENSVLSTSVGVSWVLLVIVFFII